jgi:hypothetical protein
MKTTTKLFAALTIMMGFAVTTFGQNTVNHAYASVVSTIAITAGSPLQFGNVLKGPTNYKTISASGAVLTGANSGASLGNTEAQYTISKSLHSQVQLTLSLPTDLLATSNATVKLPITFTDEGTTPVKLGAIGSVPYTPSNSPVDVSFANYPTEFNADSFVLHIGGRVTAAADQLGDSYSGTITLSAIYN